MKFLGKPLAIPSATATGEAVQRTYVDTAVLSASLTFRGAYSGATAYAVNDVVTFSNGSYVARAATTGTAPTAGVTTATWAVLSLPGVDGVGFTARGAWTSGSFYAKNDVVIFGGDAYAAVVANNAVTPVAGTTTATWAYMVAKGASTTYRGVWAVGTAYAINDMVTYQGSTYIAVTAHTGTTPNTSLTTPWRPIALGLNNRGAWNPTPLYYINDVVQYNGSSWMWVSAPNNSVTPTSSSLWVQLSAGLLFRGAYSGATAYAINDVVSFGGSSFISLTGSTGTSPVAGTSTAAWGLMSLAGTNGSGFVYRGVYSGATAYAVNDVVYSGGSSYVNLIASTGTAPTAGVSSATWGLVALQGTAGTAGAGLVYRDAYNAGTTYAINDAVYFSGSTYVNLVGSTGVAPTAGASSATWGLLALAGANSTSSSSPFPNWVGQPSNTRFFSWPVSATVAAVQINTTLFGHAMRVPNAIELKSLWMTCTTAVAGSSVDLWLYNEAGNGGPSTRIIGPLNYSTAATGAISNAAVLSFTQAQTVWVMYRFSVATVGMLHAATTGLPSSNWGGNLPTAATPPHSQLRWFTTYTAGVTVPADLTGATQQFTSLTAMPPMVFFGVQ